MCTGRIVGFKQEQARLLAMGREVEAAVDGLPPGGRGKPRLFIKKMVLENFKSYAGKQNIGPFHKVRAVVMPLSRTSLLFWQVIWCP